MKHVRLSLIPLVLLTCLNSRAAIAPDQLFPEDCTLYIAFSDISRTVERWKSSPVVREWKSDEFRDIREWIMEDGPMAELFGDAADDPSLKAMKESIKLYTGSFALGVIEGQAWLEAIQAEMEDETADQLEDFDLNAPIEDLDAVGEDEEEGNHAAPAFVKHLVFVAEMGDNEAAIRAINLKHAKDLVAEEIEQGAKSRFSEQKIDGVDVLVIETRYEAETEFDYTAYLDGIEISSGSESALRMMIDHIRSGSAPQPLSGNRDYAKAKAQAEKHDVLVHVNLTMIGQYIQKQMAEKTDPSPLLGVSPAQIAQALELDALAPVTATLELRPEGIAFHSNLGFTRQTRLSKVILPYVKGAFPRPNFIPKDAISVSSLRVGFAPWWDSVVGLMGALSPQLGMMANMLMLQSQEELGFDIKADFINALDDAIVYAQKMSPDGPGATDGQSTLVGIKVKDRASIERVIRKLSIKMSPDGGGEIMKAEEFLEHKIHSINLGLPLAEGDAPTIAYSFIGDYLVLGVGADDLVKSAVRAWCQPGQSIWQTPEMERALSMLPDGGSWFEYGRVDQVFKIMGGLVGGNLVGGLEPGVDPDEDADEDKLPDMRPLSRLIGQAVNSSTMEEQRIFNRGFLLYPVDR